MVGAGASSEFGLPLGSALAADIRNRLQSELSSDLGQERKLIDGALNLGLPAGSIPVGQSLDWREAARELAAGLISARSIDRLLDSRMNKPLVVALGKYAIAQVISEREARSWISVEAESSWNTLQIALTNANQSWLGSLFSLRQEGTRPADAGRIFSDTCFITFNYDRIIERYLKLAFQHVLSLPGATALALVDAIDIEHVYGSLGPVHAGPMNDAPFGLHPELVGNAVRSFRTFTEGVEEGILERIQAKISDADLIVFLGFSFDTLNLDALFGQKLDQRQMVVATTFGMGENEVTRARERMGASHKWLAMSMPCMSLIGSDEFRSVLLS